MPLSVTLLEARSRDSSLGRWRDTTYSTRSVATWASEREERQERPGGWRLDTVEGVNCEVCSV